MRHLLLPILLFSFFSLKAKEFSLFINIDLVECPNCLNALYKLNELDENVQKVFVFKSLDQYDSATIMEQLNINLEDSKIIWSDSLFRANTLKGNRKKSSFVFKKNNNDHYLKEDILKMPLYISLLNQYFEDSVIISFEEPFLRNSLSFNVESNDFYFKNLNTEELFKIDKINFEKQLFKVGKDYSIESTYNELFKDEGPKYYKNAVEGIKKYNIYNPYKVSNYYLNNDTLYLLNYHTYIFDDGKDTLTPLPFFSIARYYLDDFIDNKIIDYRHEDTIGIINSAYVLSTRKFTVGNNKLYFPLLYRYSSNRDFFMVEFKEDQESYIFNDFYDFDLPSIYYEYELGSNYNSFQLSDQATMLLPISNQIFSLEYPQVLEELDIVSSDFKEELSDRKFPVFIYDYKIDDDYVYLIIEYFQKSKSGLHYVKWDRTTKKQVINKKIESSSEYALPKLDNIDANRLYIPVDIDKVLFVNMNKN